ncbi:MAG: ribonuclease III [Candidatus Gracilibacteria bacterium]|nr:ribonuclease III [Candidatus Gracilibacteria bacterium]MDQ7022695.1 ribonuclease III [Candidatus Gracilibacteria bacterium]
MVITRKAIKNPNYIEKYSKLANDLKIEFKNIELYILAFIHRSVVNEKPDFAPEHNERLEFLGDAVLELTITERLYSDFSEKTEGELTDIRSALVRGRNLALVSRKLELNKYLILGNGERKSGGEDNDYILANTVESLIGAIYLDLGFKIARDFIIDHIYKTSLDNILEKKLFKDAKSSIQEYIQANFEITPNYKVISESGPDHNKNFEVAIFMLDKQIGLGMGSSKKKAEESAAINACNSIIKK